MTETRKRECGGCTACCYTHSVAKQGTPVTRMFEWCEHCVQGSGCSIYKERPFSCSVYKCAWLASSLWSENMRPDRWGIVIDTLDIPGEQVILLYFWEYTEGRYADHDVQQIIKGLAETGKFIVVGRPMNKEQEFHFPSTMTEEDSIRFAESITTYFESRETEAKAVGA